MTRMQCIEKGAQGLGVATMMIWLNLSPQVCFHHPWHWKAINTTAFVTLEATKCRFRYNDKNAMHRKRCSRARCLNNDDMA